MKRSLITSSLAVLSMAFLLPMGASAATVTNATAAKHTTAAKNATAAKHTTAAKTASAAKTESTTPAKNATATKSRRHHTMAKNASASKVTKIDVNTATREELMTLPGIDGDAADKIIAGRPYKNMSQLKTKGGVTNAEYKKINRKVTAKQAAAMHSEAPANGTQNESGAQNTAGSEGAASTSGSSDQTTK